MKTSFVPATIFAALILVAVPTSGGRLLLHNSRHSVHDVAKSINQWSRDVDNVNRFLNAAASIANPTRAAAKTKQTALDEPKQLGILSRVPGLSANANNAVKLLNEVFGKVPSDLQKIVDDPSPSNVQAQLHSININRCLNVLPALDTLWPAAAAAVGIDLSTVPRVQRPAACATIS